MGATGLEHTQESTGKTAIPSAGGAECGALSGDPDPKSDLAEPADPDLAAVIATWPDLPEAVRAGIAAMVAAMVAAAIIPG